MTCDVIWCTFYRQVYNDSKEGWSVNRKQSMEGVGTSISKCGDRCVYAHAVPLQFEIYTTQSARTLCDSSKGSINPHCVKFDACRPGMADSLYIMRHTQVTLILSGVDSVSFL